MLNRTLNVEGDPLGQIASLITVRDIFTPFVAVFDAARQIPDVWEEWSMELAVDESPLDQMALVVSDGEPVGSLTFDELDEEKGELSNCVDAIHLDRLITDDMPLMQAVKMFAEEDADYYLYVISGNQLVGWLSYLYSSCRCGSPCSRNCSQSRSECSQSFSETPQNALATTTTSAPVSAQYVCASKI